MSRPGAASGGPGRCLLLLLVQESLPFRHQAAAVNSPLVSTIQFVSFSGAELAPGNQRRRGLVRAVQGRFLPLAQMVQASALRPGAAGKTQPFSTQRPGKVGITALGLILGGSTT